MLASRLLVIPYGTRRDHVAHGVAFGRTQRVQRHLGLTHTVAGAYPLVDRVLRGREIRLSELEWRFLNNLSSSLLYPGAVVVHYLRAILIHCADCEIGGDISLVLGLKGALQLLAIESLPRR